MSKPIPNSKRNAGSRGFTLLELMIAMAIFLVITGAALSLFTQNQPVFTRQQNQSSLNIVMRNAVAQLQLDVVNAGTGYYPGTDFPDWPVGITITNQPGTTACNTPSTYTYSATCFDTLNVITTDPNTPAAHPDNGTFAFNGGDCINTNTAAASTMYVAPTAGLAPSNYVSGDELLLVDTTNSKMTTIKLTSNGSAVTVGAVTGIKFTFDLTDAQGTNSSTNDPLNITTSASNPKLNAGFCYTDWIMRLAPITYQVDTSNASDPKLVRIQGGTTSTLAEQVIGFKVGAVSWQGADDTTEGYSYCADNAYIASPVPAGSCSGYSDQWWLIRSVQISLIARTTPITDPTYTYRNGFDGGPYQIESLMAVVNPRNLSMNNQ